MNLLTIFLAAAPSFQADAAENSIHAEDLRAHIYFLASEELQGRDAGTESEILASRYLAEQLRSFGVLPAGEAGSYFQPFEAQGRKMRNVAGWIEGSDPELKKQFVVLGAHFDHVGWGGKESLARRKAIHNGADDNGSGTASLLELAQSFANSPPKRSLLILHFSGEEKGLLGSMYYCENPLRPIESTVAMLNMDMVGRSENHYLFIGGTGTGEGFSDLIASKASGTPLRLETQPGGMAPSDNTGFYNQQLPVLFFFTNVHEDYHAPGDDWWKINYEDQVLITRLIYRVGRVLADEPKPREFHSNGGFAVPKDFGARMGKLMGPKKKVSK